MSDEPQQQQMSKVGSKTRTRPIEGRKKTKATAQAKDGAASELPSKPLSPRTALMSSSAAAAVANKDIVSDTDDVADESDNRGSETDSDGNGAIIAQPQQPVTAFRSASSIGVARGLPAVHAIEYSHGRHLPCAHTRLAEPCFTLRYELDAHLERLRGVYKTSTAGILIQTTAAAAGGDASTPNAAAANGLEDSSSATSRRFASLRRKKTQQNNLQANGGAAAATLPHMQPLSGRSSSLAAATAALRSPELSQYAGERALYLAPSADARGRLELFLGEVERLLAEFPVAHTHFVNCLCREANIAQQALRSEIEMQSAFAMLDHSVTRHVLLRGLGLSDNRNFYEIGRAALAAHVHTITFLQGFDAEVAARRIATILGGTHVWLTKRFGRSALLMLPLMWQLETAAVAGAPAVDIDVMQESRLRSYQDERLQRVAIIWLGLLELMALQTERNMILVELIKEFV